MPANSSARGIGIFGDARTYDSWMLGQIAGDRLPGLAEVGGLVDQRIAVVHQVEIDADVGRAGIEVRRLDAGDRPQAAAGR